MELEVKLSIQSFKGILKHQVRHIMNKIQSQCYGHFALTSSHFLSSVQIDFTKKYPLPILCLLCNVWGVWLLFKLLRQPGFCAN